MNGSEQQSAYIRWFSETGIDDVAMVGGKNASLGEMYRELAPQGVRVPNGFAVTADAYRHFMRESGLDRRVRDILSDLDAAGIGNLRERGRKVRHAILAAELPAETQQAIVDSYDSLGTEHSEPLDVAVRSSATAEDLPDASFAGQQESYLNVQGHRPLLETCRCPTTNVTTSRSAMTTFSRWRSGSVSSKTTTAPNALPRCRWT